MSKKYDYAVFIGRMEPPHKAHIRNIRYALENAKKAIVIFGSSHSARTIKNPWTAQEREEMVRKCFSKEEQANIIFGSVRDYFYNDNTWVANIQQIVAEAVQEEHAKIALIGRYKDHTSYYLDLFPQWKREMIPTVHETLNATDIRDSFLNDDCESKWVDLLDKCDEPVADWLALWHTIPQHNDLYVKLCEEWKFIQDYKKMWKSAPYPVTFVTTDAVLVKAGHVLMVKRKFNPGKGLLALPGGFLQQNTRIIDSALKELKEETRIKLSKEEIMNAPFKDEKVFDHPNRSLRGRTITHAFYFELPAGGELPQVKGDDDAERAMWVPIAELFYRETEIYEDHMSIINWFYSKPR